MTYLLVFFGGGLGAALRHGINVAAFRLFGPAFPIGTLFINVTGSFVMGLIAGYFALKGDLSQNWRLFLTTGILGGYTTFSAFSLDAILLWERSETGLAILYVAASVILSLVGLVLGLWIARSFG
ncbi:putative fluoride ion transporter CrcB [Variibacter gotjawalensis]|uniref:Fluoride-specific ion channel FluC n=1 Tax=Variibacter gotjawalensis TaxID=1333996 RepID=A0A0S3PPC5_9BRAD|nr:fluoride efflux transporter CrcB [Variibacter gotjawalensis]NIK48066.1 CrcB protein [Variibacter gotjawalensis]RZS49942.1 camphor resistance protein CrcB [Variibacter gotjawalensis]BAT57769.1 putative fluoride ion transporter CrcB [Variibacter gotjawalensis]